MGIYTEMNKNLTLIVPLLDRHELTNRALENLDKQRCEFKIIVADGSWSPWPQQEYKNLNIEYFYHGPDETIKNYMYKMKEAAIRVDTPLCMFFDNDDLIDLAGIRNGIKFMCDNEDYSTYQNDVRVLENNSSKFEIGDSLYTQESIESDDLIERFSDCVKNFNSFNYAIFRTKTIKYFFTALAAVQNNDYQLFQKTWAYVSAISGKCKRLHDQSYYYFIPGNSIIQSGDFSGFFKFGQWLKRTNSGISFAKILSILSFFYSDSDEGKKYFKDVEGLELKSKDKFGKYNEEIKRYLSENPSPAGRQARRVFANYFFNELCIKNSVEMLSEIEIDDIVSSSFQYDGVIKKAIKRIDVEQEESDIEYDIEKQKASHEDFVIWLNM
tara:strand:- start:286 stop:1434 length:1149 start_codon:yes stop_codon:yes gene_type:complete